MYIAVTGHKYRMREVNAYLYHGQSIVRQPEENYFSSWTCIVDTATTDAGISNYLKDRLSSGMFGVVLFPTLEEANKFVDDSKTL